MAIFNEIILLIINYITVYIIQNTKNLIDRKIKSIIKQKKFNGGVAQSVRARDS